MSTSPPSQIQLLLPYLSPSLLLFAFSTSLFTFILRRPKTGSIALPLHTKTTTNASNEGEGGQEEDVVPDPFNLYDPLIFIDGTSPDDGTSFYRTIKLVKIPLLLCLIALLGTKLLSFLLPLLSGRGGPSASALPLLETIISLTLYTYLLALGIAYVPMDTQPKHWGMTIHIASLVGTVAVVRSLEVLLPHERIRAEEGGWEGWLPFVELGVASLATAIVVSIPRGPELYFPMEKLYTA